MLSIALLARNSRQTTIEAIQSLLALPAALGLTAGDVEYILIDDHSDEPHQIAPLFLECRGATQSAVRAVRFTSRQHYTYGVACAMSLSRGEWFLFVSHDMVVPPACAAAMFEAAATDAAIGIVRPTSRHMDGLSALQIAPPAPCRTTGDVETFARCIAGRFAGEIINHPLLIGHAML